jgi:hypothetical protein
LKGVRGWRGEDTPRDALDDWKVSFDSFPNNERVDVLRNPRWVLTTV